MESWSVVELLDIPSLLFILDASYIEVIMSWICPPYKVSAALCFVLCILWKFTNLFSVNKARSYLPLCKNGLWSVEPGELNCLLNSMLILWLAIVWLLGYFIDVAVLKFCAAWPPALVLLPGCNGASYTGVLGKTLFLSIPWLMMGDNCRWGSLPWYMVVLVPSFEWSIICWMRSIYCWVSTVWLLNNWEFLFFIL